MPSLIRESVSVFLSSAPHFLFCSLVGPPGRLIQTDYAKKCFCIQLFLYLFILGGVLVPIPIDIGPKELQRRISACKPSCVVAGGGAVDEDLLDVIDQVIASVIKKAYFIVLSET